MEHQTQVEQIPIADLGKTWGPRPTDRMIEHIKRQGVLVPILVAQVPDDDGVLSYHIIDGNRRVVAAREAGFESVPAIVLDNLANDEIAELTLSANTLRTSNPVTEWWAIDDLRQHGVRDQAITERTGLTPAALKARAKYGSLDPRIFSGLVFGKIAPSVVDKASRLPTEAQDRIGDIFEKSGELQTWQVENEAKHYRQPRAAAAPRSEAELATQLEALAAAAIALGVDREAWLTAAADAFQRAQENDDGE
ncbi:MAG TPA: ParB N-terminal domain-containing protein [Thermomicrobiales bacterium]|nr:ParB N-terminal domain-containing protein [Thermomicrobiales bacterium]